MVDNNVYKQFCRAWFGSKLFEQFNLDQTHQRATLDLGLHCVRCARSPAKKDIALVMKTRLYAERVGDRSLTVQ